MKCNSMFDVISKSIITIAVVVMTIICCYKFNRITDILEQIRDCQEQIDKYPTLRNVEVQTERADSLMQLLRK